MILMILPLDEHPGDSFVQAYWHILSDPAHLAVEVTLMILLDGLLLGLLWPMVRAYVNRKLHDQHAILDAEHGIEHHRDHVHLRSPAGPSTEDAECGD